MKTPNRDWQHHIEPPDVNPPKWFIALMVGLISASLIGGGFLLYLLVTAIVDFLSRH